MSFVWVIYALGNFRDATQSDQLKQMLFYNYKESLTNILVRLSDGLATR